MNTIIQNLSSIVTGSKSDYYAVELKPYLTFLVVNVIGLVGLTVFKTVFEIVTRY